MLFCSLFTQNNRCCCTHLSNCVTALPVGMIQGFDHAYYVNRKSLATRSRPAFVRFPVPEKKNPLIQLCNSLSPYSPNQYLVVTFTHLHSRLFLFLQPEEWPANPDDFMDLFQLDTNLLFSESSNGGSPDAGMNDISSSLISNLQNGFSSSSSYATGELGMMANLGLPEQAMSPLSSLSSDQEFHGFPGSSAGSLEDDGEDEFMGDASPEMAAAVVPTVAVEQPAVTTIKMDLLEDDGMAEFNEFERCVAEQQQQQQQLQGALSSAASDSGLSSDNLDL